jgi:hypothetical protein
MLLSSSHQPKLPQLSKPDSKRAQNSSKLKSLLLLLLSSSAALQVGIVVGLLDVGVKVGPSVGSRVGVSVGNAVGTRVGLVEGLPEGAREGLTLGVPVVGLDVGRVGDLDTEGITVGFAVGFLVGFLEPAAKSSRQNSTIDINKQNDKVDAPFILQPYNSNEGEAKIIIQRNARSLQPLITTRRVYSKRGVGLWVRGSVGGRGSQKPLKRSNNGMLGFKQTKLAAWECERVWVCVFVCECVQCTVCLSR